MNKKILVPKDFEPKQSRLKDTRIYKSTSYHQKFDTSKNKSDKTIEEIQETRNKYAELSKLLSFKSLKP